MDITYSSDSSLFFRSTDGNAVGIAGVMNVEGSFTEGHYLLDMRYLEQGQVMLIDVAELTEMAVSKIEDHAYYPGYNLSEIARQQFVQLDTTELAAHVYAREVFADSDHKTKVVAFIGVIRRSSMNGLPFEKAIHGRNGSMVIGSPIPSGLSIQQVTCVDEMALSDGRVAYSGNACEVDVKRRAFYLDLLSLGCESSNEERRSLYMKWYPGEFISSNIYDDDFLEFMRLTMLESMDAKAAIQHIKS